MVPPPSHKVSRVSWYSGYRSSKLTFPYGAFTLSGGSFQNPSGSSLLLNAVHTPWCTHHGLGSSAFARRYLRNHYCFLFLSLLRCFSSGGSRLHTMDSCAVAAGLLQQVSPFRDPRITGYLLLPAAYRSLSRLSSALSAKASTLRSFCLTASCPLAYGHAVGHVLFIRMSSCFARLSACACFFVDTSLITCIHLGCLDILIRLECFVLYVVFKVRSTMFTDDRVQACLITRFRREHCILCRRSSEECEAFRTVGTKPVCQS